MMDYWIEKDVNGFKVLSGDRSLFALTNNMRDAVLIQQAMMLLEGIAGEFPGIVNGEDDVSGGNLVDFFNNNMGVSLRSYLAGEGGERRKEGYLSKELELARAWLQARNDLEDRITANLKIRAEAGDDAGRRMYHSENSLEERDAYRAFRDYRQQLAASSPRPEVTEDKVKL